MINKLKNWWLVVLGTILLIADSGFDAINPILLEFNIPANYINVIKVLFTIYTFIKLKLSLPSMDIDKLKEIFSKKIG